MGNETASLTKSLRSGKTATITRENRAWTVRIDGAVHAQDCKVTAGPKIGTGRTAITHVITNGTAAPVGITKAEAEDLRRAAAYLDPQPARTGRRTRRCVECGGPLHAYGQVAGLTGADHGAADRCYDCA